MAEQIPFGIAQQLISALGSTAFEEIKLVKGAKQELKKLSETVTCIHAVLQDADEQQQKNKLVQQWIRRLRDVLYEADDLIDKVATESLRHKVDARERMKKKVGDFFSSSNQLVSRVKMGHQIKEIREKLDGLAKDMSVFNFLPRTIVVDSGIAHNARETESTVPKYKIIGREKNGKDVIKLLKQPVDQNSENVSIVAIVGMGGLGKTTLAQKVYNDGWVKTHFTVKMWVCVSEDFNVKKLVKQILQSLTGDDFGNLGLEQLQGLLRQKLEGQKYLLVLDDVWNENRESWDGLEKHLCCGAQGSKILVTTRNKKVAIIMGVDGNTSLYKLKGLTDDESWNLFKQVAFGREKEGASSSRLLEVGKELVTTRCKGVPLAIKTLASAIQSYPDEGYWLSSMKEDEVWSLPGTQHHENSILPVLKLSYNYLPNHLKQCFTFCSIFPKDAIIGKEWLVRLWLAQGYIQSSTGGKDFEEIGDMYFYELLSRSFFQVEEEDILGNIKTVKMHDLIHDLAWLVTGEDVCLISCLDKEKKVPEKVHHVVFDGDGMNNIMSNEIISILKPISKVEANLRTLTFDGDVEGEEIKCYIPDFIFSNFKCLRVLVLRFSCAELPSSIGKLKHLRLLSLKGFELKKLPDSICNLLNLQSLTLSACLDLEELPKDIRKLVSLRNLKIECCPNLRCMRFGELAWLRQLPIIYVTRENSCVLNELSGLNLLRGELCLKGLENVRDVELEAKQVNLKGKNCLQCLHFSWSHYYDDPLGNSTIIEKDESLLDILEPHPNLKAMFVSGYGGERFSGWLSCITSLVHLDMFGCDNCKHLPPLDQLKSLKILELACMRSLEYVELSSEASSSSSSLMMMTNHFFPSLEELQIRRCDSFRGWLRSNDDDDNNTDVDVGLQPACNWFPRLSTLIIVDCPKLSSMPLFPTLEEELDLTLASTKPLQQTMEMKITNKNAASSSSSSSSFTCLQLSSSPLSKLKRLSLLGLLDLQSVTLSDEGLCALTALESLEITYCPRLTSLPDSFHHLSSLQRLSIFECEELSERCRKDNGPDWWKIQHIPNISTDYEEIGER